MRKMTFIACAATLLASTCMFTACKKDKVSDELQQSTQEGSYKGEVVKTEFSIALPAQAAGSPNRMPGTTIQKEGRAQFQGMTGITLIPFDVQSPTAIGSTTARLGDNITLTDIAEASALVPNNNAKVYTNVSIPTSTAAFLFYATSKATGTKHAVGSLTANGLTSSTPAGISFTLEQIQTAIGAPTGTGTSGEALIAYLNSIANTTDGLIAWKNYTNTESEAMTALFTEFKKWHSLSSTAVQDGLADLYTTLSAMSTTGAVTTLVTNLKAAIANATYATVSGAGTDASPYVVALKNSPLDLTDFPGGYGLPEGSVRIKWDTTDEEFKACTKTQYTDANNAPLDAYVYPASLWYFANSYIKTSNYSQQARYIETNTWNDILNAHGGAAYVNPSTHAVAIVNPIQYAVARLDVIVKLNATALEDNKAPTANTINCNSYPLTAVLVGGQKNVNYLFQPITTAPEYTIYDNVMTSTINVTTTNAVANSTLVMESEQGSTKDIQIAIELENASGHDFVGYDGEIIKAGAKFYLPATLKAESASVTTNKVFQQDYTTTATLTIKSLKNARNTIPDLRTPQLDLGMSVNLEWTAGNVYNIDIN